ncbi:MAG: hypothetical protein AB9M53_02545, partial [Leptothrix sp. (in: b-proteobacteria)]
MELTLNPKPHAPHAVGLARSPDGLRRIGQVVLTALITALSATLGATPSLAQAQTPPHSPAPVPVPPSLQVRQRLAPPPAGVTDLKFGELVRLPVGALGLEPSERALALAGRRVRLVGFMLRQASAVPGRLVLTPTPLAAGDEDEGLADDLPGHAVFVHLARRAGSAIEVPQVPGLIQLTGTLELGAQDEADGRVSSFRLRLDAAPTRTLIALRRALDVAALPPRRGPSSVSPASTTQSLASPVSPAPFTPPGAHR